MSAQGWRLLTAGLVVALLLAASGCRSMQGREHQQEMDDIAAAIQADLAAHPDVTEASVSYTDYFLDTPAANASILIRSGANPEPLVDEAVRLIWLSQLAPIATIAVSVRDATTNYILTSAAYDPEGKDQAQLESRYGPRPSEQSG